MNLSTCVPLQPFGFNFTGGKLLTKLIFSKEVLDEFKKKYKQNLLGITTTGVYGKSIQYDRLKEMKFVGYTKGFSTFKIPVEIINKCRQYLIKKNIKYKRKLHIVTKVLSDLGLNKNDYISDNMKGIYFGFCHPDANKFLKGEINELSNYVPRTANEIFKDWFDRWAFKRYNHLEKNNRLNLESTPITLIFDKEIKK